MGESEAILIGHDDKGHYIHDRFGVVRQEADYIVPPDNHAELDNYLPSSIVRFFEEVTQALGQPDFHALGNVIQGKCISAAKHS